nr:MAG TPA: hypothetical protein [Caudoviricetes sp.]
MQMHKKHLYFSVHFHNHQNIDKLYQLSMYTRPHHFPIISQIDFFCSLP